MYLSAHAVIKQPGFPCSDLSAAWAPTVDDNACHENGLDNTEPDSTEMDAFGAKSEWRGTLHRNATRIHRFSRRF